MGLVECYLAAIYAVVLGLILSIPWEILLYVQVLVPLERGDSVNPLAVAILGILIAASYVAAIFYILEEKE